MHSSGFVAKKSIADVTYQKMQEAASHDFAMQLRLLHQQKPNQQWLMLAVPTIHQAVKNP